MDFSDPVTLKLTLFVLMLGLSFGLGWAIANAIRWREMTSKLTLLFLCIFLSLSPFINASVVNGKPWYEALQFGIDLAGGTNLVYQLAEKPKDPTVVDKMVGAIKRRIDPAGTKELTVRQVGTDQIEIIIPRATPEIVQDYKEKIRTVGQLEFNIVANRWRHSNIIERGLKAEKYVREGERIIAEWRPIKPIPALDGDGKEVYKDGLLVVEENNRFGGNPAEIGIRQIKGKPKGYEEVLLLIDPPNRRVTGERLVDASPGSDEVGKPCVEFVMDMKGASLFAALTAANLPNEEEKKSKLAIVLDGTVQSAPEIRDTIHGRGQISGGFKQADVKKLVDILNAGALEVPINPTPISEFTMSPTLGIDVQQKGVRALILALIGVFVFMLYYLAMGMVSNFCLVLNLVFLIGSMALIDATLTLPGMAGIVLTMGMAVDANVLIYERIREELAKGSSNRMAIQQGFSKAFAAIFDSNITTLFTAAILYAVGSDQVRGFAVSLFIGLSISMYTALTVNRMILEIIERRRYLKNFSMLSFFGKTKFDFISKQVVCAIGSITLIGIGLAMAIYRGREGLDIDFTGGTMVTMQLVGDDIPDSESVRTKLNAAFSENNTDVTLEQLVATTGGDSTPRYRVRTTMLDQQRVKEILNETFPDLIRRVTLESGAVESVELAKVEEKEGENEIEEEPAAEAGTDRFGGGHRSLLKFSTSVIPSTITINMAVELSKVNSSYGTPDEAETLIGFAEVTQTSTAETPIKYDELTMQVEPAVSREDFENALAALQTTMANSPDFEEVNRFEGSVASATQVSAIQAMLLSLFVIVIYVWYRFENLYYGLAAVLALAHDVLATIGMLAIGSFLAETPIGPWLLLTDFKINLTMVAALLTIVGYSLNDTIVIFDRLREIRGKNPNVTRDMVNLAVNQTLSRTILTAGTVFVVVFLLYVFGGEGIHGFAYAMLIGTIVGCYSTVYVASPFVLYLMERAQSSQPKNRATSGMPRIAPATG